MKEGWTIKTISELCDQMNGIWKGAKPPFVTANILRTTNFTKDCQLRLDDLAIIDVEQKKMDARRLKRGDIIVEKSGGGPKQPVGRVVLFNLDESDYSFCNFTSALRIKHQTELLPDYLYKYLTYLYFSGETEKYQSNLVGFRNLDFKGYVSMKVMYPSISEQQRIVGILDAEFGKIDALKANAEKNLQNAKNLFQAALNLYFTDRKYKSSILGKECDFVRGPFGGSLKKNCFVDAGYPVYEQQHAIYNRFVFRYYVNEKKYLEMKRFTVNGGDLIMSCSGTIGKVAIVPMDAPKGIINQALLKLTPKTNLIPEYLLWYMNSISFTKQIQEHSQGAAIKNVASVAILKQISLPLPSVNEQREIIQHLNELSNKCEVLQNNYTQTIALCDDLKQALLRKAFSGEL